MIYVYHCENCHVQFEEIYPIEHRDFPSTQGCPRCGEYVVIRIPTMFSFRVREGSCGNAANGYSSTVGDSENFIAKSKGLKEPYPSDKKYGI